MHILKQHLRKALSIFSVFFVSASLLCGLPLPVHADSNQAENGTLRIEKQQDETNSNETFEFLIRMEGDDLKEELNMNYGRMDGSEGSGIVISPPTPFEEEKDNVPAPATQPKVGRIFVQVIGTEMSIRCATTAEEFSQLAKLVGKDVKYIDPSCTVSGSGYAGTDTAGVFGGGTIYIPPDGPSYAHQLPWNDIRSSITKVNVPEHIEMSGASAIVGASRRMTLNAWFQDFENAEFFNLQNMDVSKVSSMDHTFQNCTRLTDLTLLAGWNVERVSSMIYTFSDCSNLQTLHGLEEWKPKTLMLMQGTFYSCSSLSNALPIAKWETPKLSSILYLFYRCPLIKEIDLSSWTLPPEESGTRVTEKCMAECSSLETVTLPASARVDLFFSGTWRHAGGEAYPEALTSAQITESIQTDPAGASGKWIKRKPQMKFVSNGGAGRMRSVSMPSALEEYAIPDSSFTKAGAAQTGWSLDPDRQEPDYQSGDVILGPADPLKDIILYAVWNTPEVYLEKGQTSIYLRPGEYAEITDLPSGTDYSVYEKTSAGWVLVSASKLSGTLEGGTASLVSFTNQFDPDKTSASLLAEVLFDGKAAREPFRFLLSGKTLKEDCILTSTGTGTILSDPLIFDAEGTFLFILKAIPDNEDEVDYDRSEVSISVQTIKKEGRLSAEILYNGSPEPPVFRHAAKSKTGTLCLETGLIDTSKGAADPEQVFDFEIIWSNGQKNIYSLKAGENREIEAESGLGYSIHALHLPKGYTADLSDSSGTIIHEATNICKAVLQYRTEISLSPLFKVQLTNGELKGSDFSFELSGEIKGEPVCLTAWNVKDGSICFDPLEFTQVGTYSFKVREIAGTDENISYDSHEIDFSVNVFADPNKPGSLKCEPLYGKDGTDDIFINKTAVSSSLSIQKLLSGSGCQDDIHQSETFPMQIQLKQENGLAYTDSVTLRHGEETEHVVPDEEGLLEVELSNAQTVIVEDLPAGIFYSVTEINVPSASLKTAPNDKTIWYMSSSSRNLNGIIETGAVAEVVVINIPRGDEVPGDPNDHFCEKTDTSNTFQTPLWS